MPGTVVFLFGRYVTGRVDLLTRPGFRTLAPLNDMTPFTVAGEADPAMQHFAEAEDATDRVRADVRKDFAATLRASGADYLVVDNTPALLWHRDLDARTYVALAHEKTGFMRHVWGDDDPVAPTQAYRVPRHGLTDSLLRAYDAFVAACLECFAPDRIILIRTHVARFRVSEDGLVEPTRADPADARLLHTLDERFAAATGCRVSDAAMACFPAGAQWHAGGHDLRIAVEDDLVRLCAPMPPAEAKPAPRTAREGDPAAQSAADHVASAAHRGRRIDKAVLTSWFDDGVASYDDLLALAFLDQQDHAAHGKVVAKCIRSALRHTEALPVAATRERFERSLRALRQRRGNRPRLPLRRSSEAQVALTSGRHVFRFRASGAVERLTLSRIGPDDVAEFVAGRDLDLVDVPAAIGSWPLYFARARAGVTAAPTVVVPDARTLADSGHWLDWRRVLESEQVVVRAAGARRPRRAAPAATDLSFVFDPAVRICTVGGGLMDQVGHIAMFDEICAPLGLDYVLDDFRYTWWRSHNGFEASRLAPDLERRRMTSRVSPALIESFRSDVMATRLPWVFNQSRFWHDNGLPDAVVVTREYFNARRLVELGPDFPVHVYPDEQDLAGLMKDPPAPVSFFTTQQKIDSAARSASAIRRVFDYRHLEAAGLPADVAELAAILRATPHVALHVRRTDYLTPHFDTDGWYGRQDHYIAAIEHVIAHEVGGADVDLAVFSDDLDFVEAHRADYGLDLIEGAVRFVRGNLNYRSVYDSYLMALCPVVIGSVGYFAATTSLLADAPSTFVRALPDGPVVEWRRTP